MSTVTQNRARSKPADTCRLTLSIRGTDYVVKPIPNEDGRAYRLRKADGTVYDVTETPWGPVCDCPDHTFRREGIDPSGCKHVRALLAVGLLARKAVAR